MRLTPKQFAKQLPKWYDIWEKANLCYFHLEKRLTQKALILGYLEKADLVAIAKWGGNQYNRAGKVQRENTDDEVRKKTKEAIKNLGNPASAFMKMQSIRQWGLSYATKTLRCISPQNYVALDNKLHQGINRCYFPSNNEVKRYIEFLNFCQQIRQKVSVPGPREGEWFLADIEIALFQFVWDKHNKIV
jgi:peptidase E